VVRPRARGRSSVGRQPDPELLLRCGEGRHDTTRPPTRRPRSPLSLSPLRTMWRRSAASDSDAAAQSPQLRHLLSHLVAALLHVGVVPLPPPLPPPPSSYHRYPPPCRACPAPSRPASITPSEPRGRATPSLRWRVPLSCCSLRQRAGLPSRRPRAASSSGKEHGSRASLFRIELRRGRESRRKRRSAVVVEMREGERNLRNWGGGGGGWGNFHFAARDGDVLELLQ
jgi:hypothetical protein